MWLILGNHAHKWLPQKSLPLSQVCSFSLSQGIFQIAFVGWMLHRSNSGMTLAPCCTNIYFPVKKIGHFPPTVGHQFILCKPHPKSKIMGWSVIVIGRVMLMERGSSASSTSTESAGGTKDIQGQHGRTTQGHQWEEKTAAPSSATKSTRKGYLGSNSQTYIKRTSAL